MTHQMTVLVVQLAIIILVARLMGWVFQRYLKLPKSMGELAAGMAIGPYALGGLVFPPFGQALFPPVAGLLPISPELYGFAILASIILLFSSGLETDLPLFLRFSVKGGLVGLGGALISFCFGAGTALLLPGIDSPRHPTALFLGTLSVATSIGITASILSDKRKLSSPEGVTIMAAAILDDVVAIILLAITAGVAHGARNGVPPAWDRVGLIGIKALTFWIAGTGAGILLAPALSRGMKRIDSMPTVAAVCFGLALLVAGLAETAGLAMIIGAYIAGLSLSQTDIADEVHEKLHGLYDFLVPVFFAVMGMLVDFSALPGIMAFGAIFILAAFGAKLLGCGIPAMLTGFNPRGALRIGVGMLPRGEVTLIIASVGLACGAIGPDLFGVAVLVMLVAGLTSPPLLAICLKGPSGYRGRVYSQGTICTIDLEFPSVRMAAFVAGATRDAFQGAGFFVSPVNRTLGVFSMRKDRVHATLRQQSRRIEISTGQEHEPMVRLLLLDVLLDLKAFIESIETMKSPDMMGAELMRGLFAQPDEYIETHMPSTA